MKIQVRPNGIIRFASAHATVYTNFTLDADKPSAKWGDTVTFVPKIDGSPASAARWRWVPDDTSTHDNVSCPGGTQQCKKSMLSSGTMWAYLDGTPGDSASKHVTVDCSTRNSVLDRKDVRDSLATIWTLSNASSSNLASRRERAVAVYDSAGTIVVKILPVDPASTPCMTLQIEPNPRPGTLLMQVHVHPFAVGDSLPSNCKRPGEPALKPGQYKVYGYGYGGLSGADWGATQTLPKHPIVAFDRDSIYMADPSATFKQVNDTTFIPDSISVATKRRVWSRRGNSCSIIAY